MDKKARKGTAWLFTPLWLVVILAMLVLSLRFTINNRGYFLKTYLSMEIEREIGISAEDSANAIMAMIDYMEGQREDIQLEVAEHGQSVDMFNQKEIDHMVDVRNLYQAFCYVEYAGLAILAVLFIMLFLARKKRPDISRAITGGLWRALVVFACLLAVLGAYAIIDFYDFWTRFHYVFFTNDLWLMNYNTDRMIRICPLELFSGIIARFTVIGLCALALVGVCAAQLCGRRRNKAKRA